MGGIQKPDVGQVSSAVEVDALCRGAAVLSREDNRIAARALLWAAVAIDPQNFVAHRRLAAALLSGEDVDAAADEYARFIELLLKEDDVRRAAGELAYARSFLGDVPQLGAAAAHLVPLGEIARALGSSAPAQSSPPLALADYAATRAPSGYVSDQRLSAQPTAAGTSLAAQIKRWAWEIKSLTSEIEVGEYVLAISLGTAATVLVVFAIGGFR